MNFSTTLLPYLENTHGLLNQLRWLGQMVALESANGEHPNGRWSIISAQPLESVTLFDKTNLDNTTEKLEQLNQVLPFCDSELPFTGGLIGHLSYDLGLPSLELPRYSSQPLLLCGLYTWAFLIDHSLKQTQLVYWSGVASASKKSLVRLFEQACLNSTDDTNTDFSLTTPFKARWDKTTYKQKIDRIHDYILSGDSYQVNLAQSFSAQYQGSTISAYNKIKHAAKVPFACYFEFDHWAFASATPELFLQYDHGIITTKPIKGTRPRLTDKQADQQQIAQLKNSEKDKAENLMIVDLLRNDLSKHADNVRVDRLFDIESFSTVHHLVSTINASANSNDLLKLLIDAFPGGSITGAPKKRAMEIINELEQSPRSFYCGSSFYLSSNQKMNSNILIRGFLFEDSTVTCWAGGGIVADSKWDEEYQESLDKISKLMASLN